MNANIVFRSEPDMNAITTLVQPESAAPRVQFREIQRVTQFPSAAPRAALETELSDIIGRVATGAIAEAQAAVARARVADQAVLEAARVALEQQTNRNNGLSASLQRSESLIEELRVQLDVERDNTKAATESYETAQKAHAEQVRALQAELDAARAALSDSQQQYEREAATRARAMAALERAMAALNTVRQACALVESEAGGPDVTPTGSRREVSSGTQDEAPEPAQDDRACEPDTAASSPDRSLKLVAPAEAAPVAPPPHLAEYLRELFDQIKATYIVDLQTHAMAAVVDRLCANVRHARDVFVQRASVEDLPAGDLFDQALSAKLHEFGATSLGRHLSIVAYELAHPDRAELRAEAS
jgi:hypothetical protein